MKTNNLLKFKKDNVHSWQIIEGFEKYEFCVNTQKVRFVGKDKSVVPSEKGNGTKYKKVTISNFDGYSKNVYLHQLSASFELGIQVCVLRKLIRSNNLQIDHLDADPENNHPSNLQIVTRAENQRRRKVRQRKIKELKKALLDNTKTGTTIPMFLEEIHNEAA